MYVQFSLYEKRVESCRVRLPVQECLTYVQETLIEAPHLSAELNPLLETLEALAAKTCDSEARLLQANDLDERRLEYMAANLMERAHGFVWCPQCNQEFIARGTIFERYERGRGRLEGGGGRRFYCGRFSHLLFEVVDFRS